MVWSNDKDIVLLREIAAEGVLGHKQRSRERGAHWQNVADNISGMGHEVTSRGVRDHFNMMAKKYRARMAREERSTGEGGEELSEHDRLLEELIDMEDETERQIESENEVKNRMIEQERGQALEMRERAMERIGQTKKRNAGTSESAGQVQKRRKSGDMLDWLQQRIEVEKEEKEAKQEEKRAYMEMQQRQHVETLQMMQQQFSMQMKQSEQYFQQQMQEQQQQQQQQKQEINFMQQQFFALMQQQQQQTQILMKMLEK